MNKKINTKKIGGMALYDGILLRNNEKECITKYKYGKLSISIRKINKIVSMYEYYHTGAGQNQIMGTAWGAYNAVTGYYSNVDNTEGRRRMDTLLYGSANRSMGAALKEAM